MLYSCFNPQTGLYDVFEDKATHPVNGDLPVPTFTADLQVGNVGVPSLDAGRRLPLGAKRIGQSWSARGILVRCDGSALGMMTRAELGNIVVPLALAGVVAWFIWLNTRK